MSSSRMELYRQDDTRAILGEILGLGGVKIEPRLSTAITYLPKDLQINRLGFDEATDLMDKLSAEIILRRRFYDKLIRCPHCNGFAPRIRLVCIKCSSHNLLKGSAVEHLRCGYVGLEESFRAGGDIVCPKCRRGLTQIGVDYKKYGGWFKCRGCGEFFGEPAIRFYCDECQNLFNLHDAILKDVYVYEFNEDMRAELQENISYPDIVSARLRKAGFKIHPKAEVKGQSGILLTFDILVEKKGNLVAVEFVNQEASLDKILALYAKSLEVNLDRMVAVVAAGIRKEVGLLAETYGITLIEGGDAESLSEEILKILSKR